MLSKLCVKRNTERRGCQPDTQSNLMTLDNMKPERGTCNINNSIKMSADLVVCL